MNFVRFVKTPRIGSAATKKSNVKGNAKKLYNAQLSMILTITTDFSPFAGSAELLCQLLSPNDSILAEQQVQWNDTLREIKVDISMPPGSKDGRVIITPMASGRSFNNFLSQFLGGATTHVVGVETATFALNTSDRQDTVYRHFALPRGPLRIAEQAGETIIRHVWDAGIILSAALSVDLSSLPDELQIIRPLISERTLRILELGTGVGILGISVASSFPNVEVVMTDLPDAAPLVDENIRINIAQYPHLKRNASFRTLDWEEQPYPEWTTVEKFNLIVMADVTYNTATFEALVNTLRHLSQTGSKGAKVICCGKRRHEEEEGFWQLIREKGFVIQNRIVFAIDLGGNMRYCTNGEKKEGEQLVDIITMSLV
jgi:hypothetical protein